MNKTPTTNETSAWDVVPPNTPLMMNWPALERTPETPLKSKKTNKKKKAKSQKKVDIISPKEIQPIPDLEQSLLVTPQEHEKLMQLSSMFDKLDLSAIVSVLRGVNGDMTKAIDQCLVLNDELEKYEAQISKSAQESSEDESKIFSLKDSKEEEDNKSQVFSLGDSDLEGFEELGEEEEEEEDDDNEIPEVDELEDWSEGSFRTSSFEDDKKSINSESEEEEVPTSPKKTDTYTVLGEYIELPIVPTQDSEVEKWLKEFDSSYSLRRTKSADSTELDSTMGESSPLLDSSLVSVNTAPTLGDSNVFKSSLIPSLESIQDIDLQLMSSPKMSPRTHQDLMLSLEPNSKPALEPIVRNTSSFSLEPTKGVSLAEIFLEAKPLSPIAPITRSASEPQVEDRPYFFAEDDCKSFKEGSQKKMVERRQNAMLKRQEKRLLRQRAKLSRRLSNISKDAGTLTINQPIASVGIEPKEQPETVTLQFHQERVAELERTKSLVEEEKKRAMAWCIGQIQQAYEENKEKTATIEAQQEEIEQLKKQIEEMKSNEGKLQNLFASSKDIIVEGVQSLQKNISEGLAKVEKDWVILEKVKEMDVIEKVKDLDLLEKMKKLASSFKEEISFAFSNLEASVQRAAASSPSREQLSHEEEGELWRVEKASLESYIRELEERINSLQIVKEKPQEKETQVETIETQMQGTNTVSPSIASESSQTTNSFENEYSNSYKFFQQQYRQQWEQLNEKPKFYDSD